MTKSFYRFCPALVATVIMGISSSCIDESYDLADDIDMTVQVGESFTLPASSLADITLKQILDLGAESVIKEAEAGQYGLNAGDYVIVQDGKSDPAYYHIGEVSITDHPKSVFTVDNLPPFVSPGIAMFVPAEIKDVHNTISLKETNVDKQLISLKSAKVAVELLYTFAYSPTSNFTGEAMLQKGFRLEFDPNWTIAVADRSASFATVVDGHIVEFTKDATLTLSHPVDIDIIIKEIRFGSDNGLVSPGVFDLEATISASGKVAIKFDGTTPAGQQERVALTTTTEVQSAVIKEVTGVVDPEINVDDTSFAVNDIPDFLRDENNHLDIENPMINFDVTNTSPLSLSVSGILTAKLNGKETAVCPIGKKNNKDEILIAPNTTTKIVISRIPVTLTDGSKNIVVPNLGDILETVPDEIMFTDVDCDVLPLEATFVLGTDYTFDAKYKAIIPLSFGRNMQLHYDTEDTGWDEDLKDYKFKQLELSFVAINTLPLDMTPTVTPLFKQGYQDDIIVNVDGKVMPGTIGAPSRSTLTITIAAKETGALANLDGIDGIQFNFDAGTTPESVGVNLNAAQSLRFENILITVKGITLDLNDKED